MMKPKQIAAAIIVRIENLNVFFMCVNLKTFYGSITDKDKLISFTMLNKIQFNG